MAEVALAATIRREQGSSNSRRLRATGQIPGVLYGHGVEPTPVAVNARELRVALNGEGGVNALISLDVEGKRHLALARELQKHPVRNTVAHIDFLIVNRNETITAEVPLNFVGEALGVTRNSGIVEHVLTTITVNATPSTIPTHIDVDVSNLQLEDSIRVKDLQLPEGVTAALDGEESIAVGTPTRGAQAAAAEDGGEASAEGSEA